MLLQPTGECDLQEAKRSWQRWQYNSFIIWLTFECTLFYLFCQKRALFCAYIDLIFLHFTFISLFSFVVCSVVFCVVIGMISLLDAFNVLSLYCHSLCFRRNFLVCHDVVISDITSSLSNTFVSQVMLDITIHEKRHVASDNTTTLLPLERG